ncbi:MAG: nitroreductase family protein [Chlamydiota bacterium]
MRNTRQTSYPVDPLILGRRSARAMSGKPLTKEDLMPLFEAARWAPSSYNHQPWRFLYALAGSPQWALFFSFLLSNNQVWASRAGALVTLISRNRFEKNDKAARLHSFDAGSAFENLALQGVKNGLVVHPMEGFYEEKARIALQIPDFYSVQIMIAIGWPADPECLPEELRAREVWTKRTPLEELVIEGIYR